MIDFSSVDFNQLYPALAIVALALVITILVFYSDRPMSTQIAALLDAVARIEALQVAQNKKIADLQDALQVAKSDNDSLQQAVDRLNVLAPVEHNA